MSKKTRKKSSKASKSSGACRKRRAKPHDEGRPQRPETRQRASVQRLRKRSPKAAASQPPSLRPRIATRQSIEPKPSRNRPKPTPVSWPPRTLAEGDQRARLSAAARRRRRVSLADFAGHKLVMFFYPRADTPGCTREAIDFTRLEGRLRRKPAPACSASPPTPSRPREAFRDKHELVVPLISDETAEMLKAYGAWGEKSMYGRTFLGIIRTTVLVGADGRVARIWRNVRVDGHADEVLAAASRAICMPARIHFPKINHERAQIGTH